MDFLLSVDQGNVLKIGRRQKNSAWFAAGSSSQVGWSVVTNMENELSLEVRERSVRLFIDNKGENGSGWQKSIVPSERAYWARWPTR